MITFNRTPDGTWIGEYTSDPAVLVHATTYEECHRELIRTIEGHSRVIGGEYKLRRVAVGSFAGNPKSLPERTRDVINGVIDARVVYYDPHMGELVSARLAGYSGNVVLTPVEIWEQVVALVKKHLPDELDPQSYTNPTDGME